MIVRDDLSIQRYDGAYFLTRDVDGYGRGLYDAQGRFVANSGKRTFGDAAVYINEEKTLTPDATSFRIIDEPVVYAGYVMLHYGHFLMDGMIRLWPCLRRPELKKYRILMTHMLRPVPEYIYEIFERVTGLGRERLLIVQEPVRLKQNVFVPEWSYIPREYVSPQFLETFQAVAKGVEPNGRHRKLYLSRRKLGLREYGERTIEEIFSSNGFEIVYPETMTFTDQIALYQAADVMVSTAGTLGHNILWCRRSCRQALLKRTPELTLHHAAIELIRGEKSDVIDCAANGSTRELSCLRVSEQLRAYLKKENMQCNYRRGAYLADCAKYRIRRTLKRVR